MFYEKIDILGFSLYEMCLLFIVWSFIGWAIEVCAHALKMGEYSNRGFLSMPICPIYGLGVLIITILLHPFIDIPILMFICSSLICTAFELFVGVTMKMIFHNVWWDYSDEHFNFKGYICLKTSILWGMGCLIVEYCAEPQIEWLVDSIPTTAGTVFIGVMGVLIIIDCSNSVAAVYKLNLRLKEISEISEKMYNSSQKLGKALADTALTAVDKGSEAAAVIYEKKLEGQEKAAELRNDIKENITDMKDETVEKLRARYDALVAFSDKNVERMIKAFPSMHSVKYRKEFENIRAKLRERASERKDRA
jgi:uncharacterized membrane protein